jgi:hypothetical protein
MVERAGQSAKESSLRKYFMQPVAKPSYGCAIAVLVCGAIVGLMSIAAAAGKSENAAAALIITLFLLAPGTLWVYGLRAGYRRRAQEGEPKPPDEQVQSWLDEGVQRLVQHSRVALGLSEDDGSFAAPLVIVAPVLWHTSGVSNEDLVWKRGADHLVRFGIYRITVIHLTPRHLGAFACDYNFLREVALNERTDEYHYQDIVTVSTREQSTSLTLPTGEKLTSAQQFMLSVSSGESISVTIDADQLRQMTGVDKLPETGAEKAVAAIRSQLRQKKG